MTYEVDITTLLHEGFDYNWSNGTIEYKVKDKVVESEPIKYSVGFYNRLTVSAEELGQLRIYLAKIEKNLIDSI